MNRPKSVEFLNILESHMSKTIGFWGSGKTAAPIGGTAQALIYIIRYISVHFFTPQHRNLEPAPVSTWLREFPTRLTPHYSIPVLIHIWTDELYCTYKPATTQCGQTLSRAAPPHPEAPQVDQVEVNPGLQRLEELLQLINTLILQQEELTRHL